MNVFKEFWRYWKWLCVALMTSFVVLFLLSMIVMHFNMSVPDKNIHNCIESGGTWDDEALICKAAG